MLLKSSLLCDTGLLLRSTDSPFAVGCRTTLPKIKYHACELRGMLEGKGQSVELEDHPNFLQLAIRIITLRSQVV